MHPDSLAPAFRITILLLIILLVLSRNHVEALLGASSNWLWFAVLVSILILFAYFSHPSGALLSVCLCVITALYLLETVFRHASLGVVQLLSVSVLATTFVYWMSMIANSQLMVQIPSLLWLTGCVSFLLALALSTEHRLPCLNILYLLWQVLSLVVGGVWQRILSPLTCGVLFDSYWTCLLLISLINLMEGQIARRKASVHS